MGRFKEIIDKYGKSSSSINSNSNIETKPKRRTAEEIRDKYRKTGADASSAAAHARDKLVERNEKLEKLSLCTEELQNGAENYSSLAGELAKEMETVNGGNYKRNLESV